MKEFLFIFRSEWESLQNVSPEEMQATTKKWMDWVGGIAAQNKLANRGNRLTRGGRLVKPDGLVTDGPYAEIKETIGGYIMVKAESYDEAVEIANGCPVLFLNVNGSVEIREIDAM